MGNVPSQRNWWKALLPPRFPIYPIQCLPADLRAWLWWTGSANWGVCKEGKGLVTLYPLPFCLPPLGTTDFLFPVCSTIEASSLFFLQIILHSFFSLISVDKVQLFSTKWEPFTSRVYSPLQPYSYFSPPPLFLYPFLLISFFFSPFHLFIRHLQPLPLPGTMLGAGCTKTHRTEPMSLRRTIVSLWEIRG